MSHNGTQSKFGIHLPCIAVVGMGNLLLKDEGIGIHVIKVLQETTPIDFSEIMVIDGGTCPDVFYLLPDKVDKLIIVDAVKGGDKPGRIYRFTPHDIEFSRGNITSVHQLGLDEGLKLLVHTCSIPKDIVIIGVEPKEIGWGLSISPEIEEKIPQIITLIKNEIGGFVRKATT